MNVHTYTIFKFASIFRSGPYRQAATSNQFSRKIIIKHLSEFHFAAQQQQQKKWFLIKTWSTKATIFRQRCQNISFFGLGVCFHSMYTISPKDHHNNNAFIRNIENFHLELKRKKCCYFSLNRTTSSRKKNHKISSQPMTILPKKAFPTLYVQKCAFERYGSRAWFTRHPTMRHIHISVQASSIDNTSKNSIYYSTSHSRALLFIFRFFLYDFIRVFFGVCLIVFMLVDTLTRLLQKKMLFFFCFPILNRKLFRSQNLCSMLLRFFPLFYSLRHFSASNISNLCLLCWWYRGSSSIRIAKKKTILHM